MEKQKKFFNRLGVYGFEQLEPVIIAALVSEDPILLIGKAGTGKTFLLNSISEAMGLEHRHYNASLISFDDLIGFPYPSSDGRSIEFLPTPATIWEAESVLVDELSRCRAETQNKFFSIIHEKKIQGLQLHKLQYRWAAMNPFNFDGGESDEQYEGSQPLDQALADRFAFIIEVPDWPELTKKEQEAIIYPAGEAAISNDEGNLRNFVDKVKPEFIKNIIHPLPEVVTYTRLATTLLNEAEFRMSPRRARLLSRNITALSCVAKELGNHLLEDDRKSLYKLALRWSLPHRAWKNSVPDHIIDSVHSETIRLTFSNNPSELWISEFLLNPSSENRISRIFEDEIDVDTRSLAVIQMLARESKASAAVFSFAAYPLLNRLAVLNEEALNEVVRITKGIMNIDGKMEWRENIKENNTIHPCWSACLHTLNNLPVDQTRRARRARQLFLYLLSQNENIAEPDFLEIELYNCFNRIKIYTDIISN